MYYEAGEIKNKIINFSGFEFKMSAMERHDDISIQVKDMSNIPPRSFHAVNLSELCIAMDVIYDIINKWIEGDTDGQDRLISLVMRWQEVAMKQTVTHIIRHGNIPIYMTSKPTDNSSDTSYSTNRNRTREFNDMEEVSTNMGYHKAVKKAVTEIIEYEEVEHG